jgi:hypothetical protein
MDRSGYFEAVPSCFKSFVSTLLESARCQGKILHPPSAVEYRFCVKMGIILAEENCPSAFRSFGRQHRTGSKKLLRQLFSHFLGVNVPHMAVRAKNQLAAVLMTLPLGDDFHVDALFDAASDEHAT